MTNENTMHSTASMQLDSRTLSRDQHQVEETRTTFQETSTRQRKPGLLFKRPVPGRGNQDYFSRDQNQVRETRTTFQETSTRQRKPGLLFKRPVPGRGNKDYFSRDQHQVEKIGIPFQRPVPCRSPFPQGTAHSRPRVQTQRGTIYVWFIVDQGCKPKEAASMYGGHNMSVTCPFFPENTNVGLTPYFTENLLPIPDVR